jgi:O-antigen ligase
MSAFQMFLTGIVLYIPFEFRVPSDLGLRGLNTQNLLFLPLFFMAWRARIERKDPAPAAGAFKLFFATMLIALMIGLVRDASEWASDITNAKDALFVFFLYFAYFRLVRDRALIRPLVVAIVGIALLAALQAARQGIDYGLGAFNPTNRASGPFATDWSGANSASSFFIIFLPLQIALALYLKSRPWVRLAAMGGIGLTLFAIFVTYSRQAYFMAALLLVLMTLRRNLLLAIPAVLLIVSYQAWVPNAMLQRIEMTSGGEEAAYAGAAQFDSSTESRWIIWQGAFQLIAESPWGIGFNQFKREIGRFVEQYANMDAHNAFVLYTTEAGLLGLTAMIVLILALLLTGLRLGRLAKTEEDLVLARAYPFCVLGMVMSNLYGSRFFANGEVMGNFWILSGLAARLYVILSSEAEEPSARVDEVEGHDWQGARHDAAEPPHAAIR